MRLRWQYIVAAVFCAALAGCDESPRQPHLFKPPDVVGWHLENPPRGMLGQNAVQFYVEAASLECQGRALAHDEVTAYVSQVASQRKAEEIVVFVADDAHMKQLVSALDLLRKVPVRQITLHYKVIKPGFRY